MKKDYWQRIETILDTVLTLPDQERDTYLLEVCSGDDTLIREVKSILWGIEESKKTHFLERASDDHRELIDELSELTQHRRKSRYTSKQIGHYNIVEMVGSGGMGEVYRAERNDGQFRQSVAIKVLKPGYRSAEIINRFRVEQEILANLHHPNIARLYDAGITDEETPYLIMEFVDGVPIDKYANNRQLTIRQRIELFIKVCDTVQFAHTNLVIHRDLKAPNILVDAEGQIKILDFGVAKLIDPSFTDITLIETQPGQRFWTPQYASPEQMQEGVISTTSDVYSLGVLLHKLLTDCYPFDLKGKKFFEIEHIVANTNPALPSETIDKSANPDETAWARKSTVTDLKKELKGDLDSIVSKALRKEPEARFESARHLADDLQRYQQNLPVLSRKGNLRYRGKKFLRRNAGPVATLIIMLLTIAGVVSYYTIRITSQRNRAQTEARKAQLVTNFMINIFKNADPYDRRKKNPTAREILDRGKKRIPSINDPDIKATMLSALGGIYVDLGMYNEAKPLLYDALKIREKLSSDDNIALARSYHDWANVNDLMGNYKISKKNFDKSIHMAMHLNDDSLYAAGMLELGWVDYSTDNYNTADSLVTSALTIDRSIYGSSSTEVARCYHYLAWINNNEGNYPKADSLFHKSLSLQQSLEKGDHPLIAETLGAIGRVLYNAQHYDSAEVYMQKSLAMTQRIFGKKHPKVATILNGLGLVEQGKHEYGKSRMYIQEAWEMRKATLGDSNPKTIQSLGELATTYFYAKEYSKAADIFKKVTAENGKILGPNHSEVATDLNNTAMCLWKAGNRQEAVSYFQKGIKIASKTYSPAHPYMIYFRKNLADLYEELGNYQKSETLHMENLRILQDSLGLHNKRAQVVLKRLIKFYKDEKKADKVEYYSALIDSTEK